LRLAGAPQFCQVVSVIPQFSDHAANERTYLAWLRTGISIIAFGFVLERFSLFLQTVSESFGGKSPVEISHGGREAGLAMVLAGLVALVVATWRFASTERKISSSTTVPYDGRTVLFMGGLVIVLALAIVYFVVRPMLAG
jgi:putative membrane protein